MISVLLKIKKIARLDLDNVDITSVLGNRYFDVDLIDPDQLACIKLVSKHRHAWLLEEKALSNNTIKITLVMMSRSIDVSHIILNLGYNGLENFTTNYRNMCCILGERVIKDALEPYPLKIADNNNERIYKPTFTKGRSPIRHYLREPQMAPPENPFMAPPENPFMATQSNTRRLANYTRPKICKKKLDCDISRPAIIREGTQPRKPILPGEMKPVTHPHKKPFMVQPEMPFNTRENGNSYDKYKKIKSCEPKLALDHCKSQTDFEYSFVIDYSANRERSVIYEVQSLSSSNIYHTEKGVQYDPELKIKYEELFTRENNVDVPAVIDYDKCLQRSAMVAFNLPEIYYPKFMIINRKKGIVSHKNILSEYERSILKAFYTQSGRQCVAKRDGTIGLGNLFHHNTDPDRVCRDLDATCAYPEGISFEHLVMYGLEKHQKYDYYQRQQEKIADSSGVIGHQIATQDIFDSRESTAEAGVFLRDAVFYNPKTQSVRSYKIYKTIMGNTKSSTDNHSAKGFLQNRWYLQNLNPDQTDIKMEIGKEKNPHVWEMYKEIGQWIERICTNLGKNGRYRRYGYPTGKRFSHPDFSLSGSGSFNSDDLRKHCLDDVDFETTLTQFKEKGIHFE